LGKALLGSEINAQFSVIRNSKVVTVNCRFQTHPFYFKNSLYLFRNGFEPLTQRFDGRRWLIPLRIINRQAGKRAAKNDELVRWKVGPDLVDYLNRLVGKMKDRVLLKRFLHKKVANR
jgi:hypothetical protein